MPLRRCRFGIVVRQVGEVLGQDLAIASALGLLAALTGIAIMRGVALFDTLLSKINLWPPLRPALGGFIVGLLALVSPQILASGHGALHFNSMVILPVTTIAIIFVLKGYRIHCLARLGLPWRLVLCFAVAWIAWRTFVRGGSFRRVPAFEFRSECLRHHRNERVVGFDHRRPADHVFHRARGDGQFLADNSCADCGDHLNAGHARIVRLLLRDLALSTCVAKPFVALRMSAGSGI